MRRRISFNGKRCHCNERCIISPRIQVQPHAMKRSTPSWSLSRSISMKVHTHTRSHRQRHGLELRISCMACSLSVVAHSMPLRAKAKETRQDTGPACPEVHVSLVRHEWPKWSTFSPQPSFGGEGEETRPVTRLLGVA